MTVVLAGTACDDEEDGCHRDGPAGILDQWCCNGVLVDVQTNESSCGVCGNVCAPREVCTEGVCGPAPCARPREKCGDECVDTSDDERHCGACDSVCTQGESCSDGVCEAICDAGCAPIDAGIPHDASIDGST